MRHYAILVIGAVTVSAMAFGTALTELAPFYGIMGIIIGADKAISLRPKPAE